MSLTTLFLFKQHVGPSVFPVSDSSRNKKLEAIIDAVSAGIAKWCGRTFAETTYRYFIDGNDSDVLLLPQWPITRIYGCSIGVLDGLTLYAASTFKYATVTVDQSTGYLKLFSVDASATESDSSIALSGKTMATLKTAIEAVTGWTATVAAGMDNYPASMVKPFESEYAVYPDTCDLEVPDDPIKVTLVPDMERAIQRSKEDVFVADMTTFNRPYQSPVFPIGTGNVYVWYKAGYTEPVDNAQHTALTTAGTVPADLTLAANAIVKAVYDMADQEMGADSASIEGYSYSLGPDNRAMIARAIFEHRQALHPYRAII